MALKETYNQIVMDETIMVQHGANGRVGFVRAVEESVKYLQQTGTNINELRQNYLHVRFLQACLHMIQVCPNTLSQRNPWVQSDLETEMFTSLDQTACNHIVFIDYITISAQDSGIRVLKDGKALWNRIK